MIRESLNARVSLEKLKEPQGLECWEGSSSSGIQKQSGLCYTIWGCSVLEPWNWHCMANVVLDKLPVFQTLVSQSVKWGPHYFISAHRAKAHGMRTGPELGLQITWNSQASPSSDALLSCNSNSFLHPLVTTSLRCTVPRGPHLSIPWNKRDPRVLRAEELVFLPSTPPTELRILTYWLPETPTQSLG